MKQRLLVIIAAILAGVALVLGVLFFVLRERIFPPKEVRIGFIAPMTGIFAQIGKDMSNGFKMYLAQNNNKMGPLTVKFILEDSTGKPAVNVRKA